MFKIKELLKAKGSSQPVRTDEARSPYTRDSLPAMIDSGICFR